MKGIFTLFNRAQTVASLWVIAPLIPILLFPYEESNLVTLLIGVALLVGIGASLTHFRKKKIIEGEWSLSDTVVYFLVPAFLFTAVTGMIIFGSPESSNKALQLAAYGGS